MRNSEMLVYIAIKRHDSEARQKRLVRETGETHLWLSNAELSEETGLSVTTVFKCISVLAKAGKVAVDHPPNNNCKVLRVPPMGWKYSNGTMVRVEH